MKRHILRKLAKGLGAASKSSAAPTKLLQEMTDGLAGFAGPVIILLAERDRTAQMFASMWDGEDERIRRCEKADHSYSEPKSFAWLTERVTGFLSAADGQRYSRK